MKSKLQMGAALAAVVMGAATTADAFLTVRMAGVNNIWTDAADEVCGRSWGAAWYRNNCYDALKEGKVEGMAEFKINDIKQNVLGVPAFTLFATDDVPSEKYFVYGVSDEFQVPETKEYTFWVKSNFSMIIKINDKLMDNGDPDDIWLVDHGDEETRATKFANFPLSKPEKGSSEYGIKFDYPFKVQLETGKKHKLEFLYSHESQLSFAAFLVGDTPESRDYVPKEWFGEQAVVGNPQGNFVKPGATETVVEPTNRLELAFEVAVTYNPDESKAPSFEWDFDGDGTADKTTETNTTTHVYLNETGTDQIVLPNVVIVVDGRKSMKIGGPTIFLGTTAASIRYGAWGYGLSREATQWTDPLGRRPEMDMKNRRVLFAR